MKTIAETMDVALSNLKEQIKNTDKLKTIRYSKADDEKLLPMIREICDKRACYGYRRTLALINYKLVLDGKPKINHKRVYRIMKQNSLLLQKYGAKPIRVHDGKIETIASNVRWCSDGLCIQCFNGDRIYVAFSLDCHDREVMAWVASNIGIDGEMIRDLMTETIENRFGSVDVVPHTVQWLSDNGSCYTAKETVAYGHSRGLEIRTTPAYSPESNGMAESFVKTLKRDYAYLADLSSGEKVREQFKAWFEDYNEVAPHKGLKMKSPRQYLRALEN